MFYWVCSFLFVSIYSKHTVLFSVCVFVSPSHQIWLLFRAFPIFTLTPPMPRSFPFLLTVALWVALSDRRNCYSQTVIMWCELWLPPDSPVTIQWHRANVSRAVRKPHDGDDCWARGRGGKEKRREGEAWELYVVMWFLPLCFLYDLV